MTTLLSCSICHDAGSWKYENWIFHLTTEQHQLKVQQSPGRGEVALNHPNVINKVIVISDIPVAVPLIKVAKYFSKFGFLKELIDVGRTSQTTMQCIIVYNSEETVSEVLNETNHILGGNCVTVQRRGGEYRREVQKSEYKLEIGQSVNASSSVSTASSVRLDFSQFVSSEKQKDLFENQNEYQKIALQMKDDFSDEKFKFEDKVESFSHLFCLTDEQIEKRAGLATELLQILHRRFPNCAIYPFGHDYMGIATNIDTMNVCVDIFGKMIDESSTVSVVLPPCRSSLATDVFELLKEEQYKLCFCRDVEIKWHPWAYADCKIQKITFVHRSSGVVCNLVIENFTVVQETRLVKLLSSLDPRVHILLCFIRLFASVHDTLHSHDEAYKSQSMIWLLMSYLSSKTIIPTVKELQSLSQGSIIVGNCDISFCSDFKRINHNETPMMDNAEIRALSTLSVLKEFFNFYSKADLKRNVVCSATGELIPVTKFGRSAQQSKILNEDGSTTLRRFYSGSPMGLQNPLDPTTNLTKNVPLNEVTLFQERCRWASVKLEEIFESESGDLMDIFVNQVGENQMNFVPMELNCEESSLEKSTSESCEEQLEAVLVKQESDEEECMELDTEREDNTYNDSHLEIRQCRIRMSQNLRKFFEIAIASDRSIEAVEENKNLPSNLKNLSIESRIASTVDPLIKADEEGISKQFAHIDSHIVEYSKFVENRNQLMIDTSVKSKENNNSLQSTPVDSDRVKVSSNQSLSIEGTNDQMADPSIKTEAEGSSEHAISIESDTLKIPFDPPLSIENSSVQLPDPSSVKIDEGRKSQEFAQMECDIVQVPSDQSISIEASNEPIQSVKSENKIIANSFIPLDLDSDKVSNEIPSNDLGDEQLKTLNQSVYTEEKEKSFRKKKKKRKALDDTKCIKRRIEELAKYPLTNGKNKHIFFDEEGVEIDIKQIKLDSSSLSPEDEEKIKKSAELKAQMAAAAEAKIQRHYAYTLLVRKKFQALWLQFLIEFNSRFWSECFGLCIETNLNQKFIPAEYSQMNDSTAELTLKEKFELVNADEDSCAMEFHCETRNEISSLLYKKKVWSKKYLKSHIRPLWLVVSGKATSRCAPAECNESIQSVKEMVQLPSNRQFQFLCKIDINFDLREREDIPRNGDLGTYAKLRIIDETCGPGRLMRTRKMRFLATIYEVLSVKYINLRFKQWLATSQDFDYHKILEEHKKVKKKGKGHPKWRKFRRRERLRLDALEGAKR